MRTDLARLDLSGRTRSLIGYTVGIAVYTLVVVALYPAFEHSTSLDTLVRNDATAAALFGVTGSISSTGGWLDANLYANFFPLLMLLLTVGYGAAALAGQDEDGTLGLLVTLPVRRTAIVAQKVGAMVVQATTLALVVAGLVLVGHWFHLAVHPAPVVSASTAVMLMGVDIGILALAVGALTGRRGTAIGVAAGVAAASYLVSSLAPVASWIRPARFGSLFYWSVGNNQIVDGASAADVGVLVAVGLLLAVATVAAFRRFDVR